MAELNNLKANSGIRFGQSLKIPAGSTVPDQYVVQSGDSLNAIASRYNLQVSYLADLNGLKPTSGVRIGQRLKLTGEVASVQAPAPAEPTRNNSAATSSRNTNTEQYTVKAGESLNSIANRLGMTGRELADLNQLRANTGLQRGQTILIPKTVTEYRVKRGDTLIGLASRYGMQTTALAEMNDLAPNTQLRIGDVIKVPNL